MPITDIELNKISQEKDSSTEFKKRRLPDWDEDYILYRDRVITNRLTQRQTINIPLMKYGIQTVMKDIDEPPMLYFENLDNDVQKEIFFNEHWNDCAVKNKLVIRDRIDKKQALLYGRTFKKLNIVDGAFKFEVIDPQDMLVERHTDPADLDSTRCLIQINIFRTLKSILENEEYEAEGRRQLRDRYADDSNSQETSSNFENFTDKQKRMSDMGLNDAYDPLVGETYIELNEVYRCEYDKELKEDIIYLYVVAATDAGLIGLSKKPLHEVIGQTPDNFWFHHYPYTSWATDPERTDFWSDGVGDVIRQPNKVLNSWVSQLVENRTLRNFNMHYYDSTNPQFVPQTFTPVAWGWYPTPGDPNILIKDVMVEDLSESLDEIQFLISLTEKSIAASGSQTGQVTERQVTLGEVQIAVANAVERTKSMVAYYEEDWKEFGLKYSKMLEAASSRLDTVTIYKKGRNGKKVYKKEITPKHYLTKSGYKVQVRMKSNKLNEETDLLNRLNGVRAMMPDNKPLIDIQKKHALEFAGLSTEEMKDVLDFERTKNIAEVPTPEMLGAGTPEVPATPTPPVANPNAISI